MLSRHFGVGGGEAFGVKPRLRVIRRKKAQENPEQQAAVTQKIASREGNQCQSGTGYGRN
jgi:hypothetical protein